MKICHVVRQFHPSVGGLESFVETLAQHQKQLGCACDVVTLDRVFFHEQTLPSRDRVHGLNVHRVPMIGHRRFFLPVIPRGLLDSYDVIHVHAIDGMFDRVARQPRRHRQVRAATSHGGFFHTKWMAPLKQAYFNTATRLSARAYDVLLANSASDLALLRTVSENAVQLPNGVSPIGDFCATGRDLLFLGRLTTHKQVGRLIATLAQPLLADVSLHVAGPEWDVSRLSLAQAAEAYGVSDRVFLHGHVTPARLAEISRRCALFVSASTYEGFGMSLIEAMSVGLVPVVQPNASFVELIEAAAVGSLADFSNPEVAAREIRQQLNDLTEHGRRRTMKFAARFSWPAHARETLRIYKAAQRQRARCAVAA